LRVATVSATEVANSLKGHSTPN